MTGYTRIGCLRKINPEKIDTINAGTIVLNKPEIMKLIEKHRKIYTLRLGLDPNAKTEEIYSKLKKDLAYTPTSESKCDLLGLTLGFPKYNSMIFELERVKNTCRLRKYPAEFKKEILEALRSEKSPYKSLDETELQNLENAINNITEIGCYENIYRFIDFTQDKEELGRIAKAESEFIREFKVQNLL